MYDRFNAYRWSMFLRDHNAALVAGDKREMLSVHRFTTFNRRWEVLWHQLRREYGK